jgi:cytoplasmic iron level regulating protein YaaA (DUF328/UPF0246 family)
MPTTPVILLPPSEGKLAGGSGPKWSAGSCSFPALDRHRRKLMTALVKAMKEPETSRSKLLGVKGVALAAATIENLAVRRSGTMAAIDRYTGVLYDALDASGLPKQARVRLETDVVIFSGLFGAVMATDPIPDYKLKMGGALPDLGNTSLLWRTPITDALTPFVSGRTLWNLLPKEHDNAWFCPTSETLRTMSVKFLDEATRSKGQPRSFTTVNHWNKLLKGALVAFILTTGADEPDALVEFAHPEGYVYDPSLTEVTDGRTVLAMVRPPA